jgi:hypothetical protein
MARIRIWAALMLVSCGLSGCVLLVAAPFLIQNDFDDKRTELKKDFAKGLVSKESAETSCLSMLRTVDRHHVAPPPYPDEICQFESFADKRYELTKVLNQGIISRDIWEQECRALPDRPPTGDPCHLDQFQEKLAVWRSQIERGYTTKEAVITDCLTVASAEHGEEESKTICQL